MKHFLLVVMAFIALSSCKKNTPDNEAENTVMTGEIKDESNLEIKHLSQEDWTKNAVIYEVNVRQFSKEGTFKQVEDALPKIKDLGVDIVWLMPIHEIGVKNRKEGLGSYYSVKDYRSINHEFGNHNDFKQLVSKIHALGMKIIIDWVPNHTAWDHAWITEHPDYYTKNDKGEIIDPTDPSTGKSWGWTDVADLNYDNKDVWKAMTADMKYWVTDFDIDGFRCDVAGEVPTEFWVENNKELNAAKPMFMLAEAHKRELLESFNMLYSWDFMGLMNDINEGKKELDEVETYMNNRNNKDMYMFFTANHDENTWNDAPMKYGKNYHNYAVLSYTLGGMPLIYNGQEAELKHKLAFFTKDEINWEGMKDFDFFKNLNAIYKSNPALWNAAHYGEFKRIESPAETFVYTVTKGDDELFVAQNYSDKEVLLSNKMATNYTSIFGGEMVKTDNNEIKLAANSSYILKK